MYFQRSTQASSGYSAELVVRNKTKAGAPLSRLVNRVP
jgi:hypothetical protein